MFTCAPYIRWFRIHLDLVPIRPAVLKVHSYDVQELYINYLQCG